MNSTMRWLVAAVLVAVLCPTLGAAQVTPLTGDFTVNATTSVPANLAEASRVGQGIAMARDGRAVVIWHSAHDGAGQGVFAQRFDADRTPVGSEFLVNTFTGNEGGGDQTDASVGLDAGGNFVATWTLGCFGSCGVVNPSVFAQRFDSAGGKLGSEFRVDTNKQGVGGAVAVAADGDFVIAWNGITAYADGFAGGIFAQRYASSGEPVGTDFQVNTYTGGNYAGSQFAPHVAAAPNGDFVVVWQSASTPTDVNPVFGQRFASSGTPLGSEFRLNENNIGNHAQPVVSVAGTGDFVTAWTNFDGGLYPDVVAQRFASNGARLGTEFRANTYTPGTQGNASVAADADGDFVLTWASVGPGGGAGQDGHGSGIFGQRYSRTGAPQGTEFQVNQFTFGNQGTRNAVASDAKGNFVAVFEAYGNIVGRGFAAPTDPPTPTPTITFTPTVTDTPPPSETPTLTPTATDTATSTETPTVTDTPTETATPTDTETATPTETPTETPTDTPSATPTQTASATSTATQTQTVTSTPVAPPCVGDCNGDREVTVDELVKGVAIALGNLPLEQCLAFDPNLDDQVTVDELVRGVNNALNGCPRAG